MDWHDNAKIEEELQATKDTSVFENEEDDLEINDGDGSQRSYGQDRPKIKFPIPEDDDYDPLEQEDMQKIMDQLKQEMDASQRAE